MKSSTKSSIRKLLVTLLLTGSAGFFGWLFYSELNKTVENVGGVVVGEVVEVRGQAQRRFDRQSRWGTLKGAESVYNLDAIRTSSESGAVIVLKNVGLDGTEQLDEIALGPDTYIVLDLFGETRNINFVGGDLSATGGEGLTVTAEGTAVALDKGSVNLSRVEGSQTSITVTEGEARVQTGSESQVLDVESVLRIDEGSGESVREQVAVNPLRPKSNALLLTYEDERRVDFSWELFADWANPTLEVSADADFNETESPVTRIKSETGSALVLAPGVWYWRVVDAATGAAGSINVFTVDIERRARPIAPAPELVLPFRGEAPVVSIQWERSWFADSYDVELSRTASFAQIDVNRNITGSSVLIDELDEGTWWWRVTPRYRRGILDVPIVPEERRFTLERRVGRDALVLVNPPDGAAISALDVRDGVDFRWQSQSGLVSYRIEVAVDENFDSTVAASDAPENWRRLLTAPAPGTYYWRVGATSSDGQPVPDSDIRSFTIRPVTGRVELIDPAPGDIKELEPYSPYDFTWRSGVPGTSRFLLQRQGDAAGGERTKIIESLVRGESFTAPLPGEGAYVWKVQILDDSGRMLAESVEAVFRLRSEFRPPVLNLPRPGSGISLVGTTTLRVAWDPAPGADAYRVILRDSQGTAIGRDDRVSALDREFTLPPGLGPGSYGVELTSIRDNPPDGASNLSESATYRFNVDNLVRYNAAVPSSPANGRFIGGLEALREGITLTWSQDPLLNRWTVELDNGSVTRLYQTTEPRLNLEGLDSGSYTWKVLSRDSFGLEAPESTVSRFTVGGVPDPPAPIVLSPNPGDTIDMTGRRNLVFTWQTSENTDFYDLALYSEGSSTPLLQENGLTDGRFVLSNLSILDVGSFIVSIQARSEYRDVGITRTAPETRVPFTLTLNIADEAPTILTDELQYAE
ncbi:MAG: hypothetical protein P1P77_00395 [Spirochaetaceae bacterium]|nr:hypothetical protein [Spirochaetaceae bacterium]